MLKPHVPSPLSPRLRKIVLQNSRILTLSTAATKNIAAVASGGKSKLKALLDLGNPE